MQRHALLSLVERRCCVAAMSRRTTVVCVAPAASAKRTVVADALHTMPTISGRTVPATGHAVTTVYG